MALLNLMVPGYTDLKINRNMGFGPPGVYNLGITSFDTPGNGMLLAAAPQDMACTGSVAYGTITISNIPEGGSLTLINHATTFILAKSSQVNACTIVLPDQIVPGQLIKLGCVLNGITSLTMLANGALQTLYNPLTSIAAGEYATWQAILIGGHYYWARIG